MVVVVSWLIHCFLILLSVAFFTLFERKVIGLFHRRLGPNKVSYVGIVQPLLDAFKLLSKQNLIPLRTNKVVYNLSPQFSLFLAMFTWVTLPVVGFGVLRLNYSFLIFFCISSVMVFCVLFSGWSSNSKYSLIGRLRSVAQSISYESVISTIVALFCIVLGSYSTQRFFFYSRAVYLILFPVWLVCILAETHRAPFDFSESESELVSGFNTEYSGAFFAFIFLSEYGMLLFSCFFIVFIYFCWFVSFNSVVVVVGMRVILSYVFIWVRITFCRFRYDLLMIRAWKVLLPVVLIVFICLVFLIV